MINDFLNDFPPGLVGEGGRRKKSKKYYYNNKAGWAGTNNLLMMMMIFPSFPPKSVIFNTTKILQTLKFTGTGRVGGVRY